MRYVLTDDTRLARPELLEEVESRRLVVVIFRHNT